MPSPRPDDRPVPDPSSAAAGPQAPDAPPGQFRPGGVRLLAVAWWVLAAALAADLLLRGSPAAVALGLPLLLLTCSVVFAMFWYPAVLVDDDGVDLVNPVRRVRLHWASVESLDTRWALSLRADGRRWTAWAAPASGRRVRPVSRRETPWVGKDEAGIAGSRAPGSSAGEAAVLVGTRWQAWQDRHRRDPGGRPVEPPAAGRPEPVPAPEVGWNLPVVGLLVGSLALVVLAVTLLGVS